MRIIGNEGKSRDDLVGSKVKGRDDLIGSQGQRRDDDVSHTGEKSRDIHTSNKVPYRETRRAWIPKKGSYSRALSGKMLPCNIHNS